MHMMIIAICKSLMSHYLIHILFIETQNNYNKYSSWRYFAYKHWENRLYKLNS